MSKTAYETALDEFKDASAEVRRTFTMLSEAREAQILANRGHGAASELYAKATARLDAADQSLQLVRPEAPAPADIDAAKGLIGVSAGRDVEVTAAQIATQGAFVAPPNGGERTVHIPDDELRIG